MIVRLRRGDSPVYLNTEAIVTIARDPRSTADWIIRLTDGRVINITCRESEITQLLGLGLDPVACGGITFEPLVRREQ